MNTVTKIGFILAIVLGERNNSVCTRVLFLKREVSCNFRDCVKLDTSTQDTRSIIGHTSLSICTSYVVIHDTVVLLKC